MKIRSLHGQARTTGLRTTCDATCVRSCVCSATQSLDQHIINDASSCVLPCCVRARLHSRTGSQMHSRRALRVRTSTRSRCYRSSFGYCLEFRPICQTSSARRQANETRVHSAQDLSSNSSPPCLVFVCVCVMDNIVSCEWKHAVCT